MSDHSDNSKPKAPTPLVNKLHSALRMSSPEITRHVKRAVCHSDQHKSSSQKRRSSSADNFFCSPGGCVVCRDVGTPTSGRGSLTDTFSPVNAWGHRESGSSRRGRFTRSIRSSRPPTSPRSNATRSPLQLGKNKSIRTSSSFPSLSKPRESLFEHYYRSLLSSPLSVRSNDSTRTRLSLRSNVSYHRSFLHSPSPVRTDGNNRTRSPWGSNISRSSMILPTHRWRESGNIQFRSLLSTPSPKPRHGGHRAPSTIILGFPTGGRNRFRRSPSPPPCSPSPYAWTSIPMSPGVTSAIVDTPPLFSPSRSPSYSRRFSPGLFGTPPRSLSPSYSMGRIPGSPPGIFGTPPRSLSASPSMRRIPRSSPGPFGTPPRRSQSPSFSRRVSRLPPGFFGSPPRSRSSSKRRIPGSPPTFLETSPRRPSPSISPTSYQRSPLASPRLFSAFPMHKVLSSYAKLHRSSSSSTLEKHAHCKDLNCILRERYIEHTSRSFAAGVPILPKSSGHSQASLLGRHEECTCPILPTAPGEPPRRPHHEATPQDTATPSIIKGEDGKMMLLDRERRVWYLMTLKNSRSSMSNLAVVASGEYSHLPEDEILPLGYTCPCFDEVHGLGAAAKIRADFMAKRRTSSAENPQNTGYTTSKYSQDKPNDIDSKENRLGRARTALEKKYLASFPWLERRALDAKVKRDCNFLWNEHRNVLGTKLDDDDIINFYDAWGFDDGTELDDRYAVPGRDPSLIEQGTYPQTDSKGNSVYPRPVYALRGKYLAGFPWLGKMAAERKARYDVFWLEDQYLYHSRGKRRNIENRIVKFYGAKQWDTWMSGGNGEEHDSESKKDDDKERGTWPTHRMINALATKYMVLGKLGAAEKAKSALYRRSKWYRGRSDIEAMERAAIRHFGLKGGIRYN